MISIVRLQKSKQATLCQKLKNKFVIHEHHALRAGIHYDLRIAHDCVLKSWASRKMPDLVKGDLRKMSLFQTPDHGLDWFDFEGEITDVYGKGKVKIWDTGDVDVIKWDKNIIIEFKGSKLTGKYAIVPMTKEGQYLMLRSKK